MVDANYFEHLENNFDTTIAWRICLNIQGDSPQKEKLATRIHKWISKYYKDIVSFDNYTLPRCLTIGFKKDGLVSSISINGPETKVSIDVSCNEDLYFIHSPILDEQNVTSKEAELMFFISSCLAPLSLRSSLQILGYCYFKFTSDLKEPAMLVEVSQIAIAQNCITELQKLIVLAIEHQCFDEFQSLNMPLLTLGVDNEELKSLFINNLELAFVTCSDPQLKGLLAYNLANHYRFLNNRYAASEYFQIARKLRGSYLSKYYWWHEYAGVLFLSNHYRIAEWFYRKSIELDTEGCNKPMTYALLGDSQFHQLKLAEAIESFDSYLSSVQKMNKIPHLYWNFKLEVCNQLKNSGFTNVNINSQLSREVLGSDDLSEMSLLESLEVCVLDPDIHFKLGQIYEAKGEAFKAYQAFLASAVILETEKQPWISCFFNSLHLDDNETNFSILVCMIQNFGEAVINQLCNETLKSEYPLEVQSEIIALIEGYARAFNDGVLPVMYALQKVTVRANLPFYE